MCEAVYVGDRICVCDAMHMCETVHELKALSVHDSMCDCVILWLCVCETVCVTLCVCACMYEEQKNLSEV